MLVQRRLELLVIQLEQQAHLAEARLADDLDELLLRTSDTARADSREDVRQVLTAQRLEQCVEGLGCEATRFGRRRRRFRLRWTEIVSKREVLSDPLNEFVFRTTNVEGQLTTQ